MRAFELTRPMQPLKWSVRDTPHLTIERNTTCDIRCRACYNTGPRAPMPIVMIDDDGARLIRRRETFEDLARVEGGLTDEEGQ